MFEHSASSNASYSGHPRHASPPQSEEVQQVILPRLPFVRPEGKRTRNAELVNTAFKFLSTTITAVGTPSIICL